MSKQIFKYPLHSVTNEQKLYLPKGYTILSVGEQNETIMVWASVNREAETQEVIIRVVPTGGQIFDELALHIFLGTVQMKSGLVFHVFKQNAYGDFNYGEAKNKEDKAHSNIPNLV
jgi:hypothetical protein